MNKKMMMPFLALAVLLVVVIGCKIPEQSISTPSEQTAEDAEVAGELNELDELEELESELEELDWQEVEGAVTD